MSGDRPKSGAELLDHYLKTGELVSRSDAAFELARMLEEREKVYPRLIEAKRLTQAEADLRNARLAAAWLYVLDPRVELAGPETYRDDLARALWLVEARGYVLPTPPKGGKR